MYLLNIEQVAIMPDTQVSIFFLTTRIDLLPFQKLTRIFHVYTYSACYLLCEQRCSIDMCPVSIGAFCRALYAARHLKEEEPNERAHYSMEIKQNYIVCQSVAILLFQYS
jgi:hypothetical protein